MKSLTILTCVVIFLLQPAFAQKANTPPPTSTTSTIETVRRDGLDRFVTFHSNQGTIETPEMKRGKDVLGVLQ